MANARKMHEQAKRDEAQRRRDRIVSIMEADLLRRRAEQTARHHAEAEAAEAAHEEREAIKAAERDHELEMIDRSRQQQLAIRAAERARAEAEDAAFARQWKLRNEELRREEEEEKATARARAKTLQRAHVRQIQKKLAKAEAARDAEWMDTMRAERALAEDDELFKHYADAHGGVGGAGEESATDAVRAREAEGYGHLLRVVESVVGERSAGKKTRTRGETVESILVTLARSEPRVGDSPRLSPRGWAFGRARSCTEHLRVLLRVHRHGTFFRSPLPPRPPRVLPGAR